MDVKKRAKEFMQKDFEQEIIEDYINSLKSLSLILDRKFLKLRLAYLFFALAVVMITIFEISSLGF